MDNRFRHNDRIQQNLSWHRVFKTIRPCSVKSILRTIYFPSDCELQFWELSSFGFEPYCQLSALETAPLKIAYA
jgi:hypothetical protein